MRVISIDPATKTGICYLELKRDTQYCLASDTLKFDPDKPLSVYWSDIITRLREWINKFGLPDVFIIEDAPIYAQHFGRKAAYKVSFIRGIWAAACCQIWKRYKKSKKSAPIEFAAPQSWVPRSWWRLNRTERKRQTRELFEKLFNTKPPNSDIADAGVMGYLIAKKLKN